MARIRAGLSQNDLALIVGTSQANISRWERGIHIPSENFKKWLAEALRYKKENLFPEDSE